MVTFPSVAPGQPVVVSATQYVTYRTCPEQSRWRALGRFGEDTRQSLRGMLAHRMFFRHLTEGSVGPEGVEAACREEIGERFNGRLSGLGLTKMSTLRPLLAEVGDLYARFSQVSMHGLIDAEIDIAHDAGGGITLRGTIDAVFEGDRGVRLVDWKTGSLGEAQHQLAFYALLWTLDRGTPPATVEASSIATGDRYVDEPTRSDLQHVADAVADLVSGLRTSFRSGAPLPTVGGPHCRWCPALRECPEGASVTRLNV